MKKKSAMIFAYDLALFALTVLGWVVMVFFGEAGRLSTLGLANMRYFTVLSNILEGIASLLLAIRLGRIRRGRAEGIPHWLYLLKFLAAVMVAVTFLVVALFFGPWVGYLSLYRGANFWFHLIIPVLAMAEFILLDRFDRVSRRETLLAPLPALVYGLAYALNLIIHGVGEPPDPNDFYGFASWGLGVGFGIFALILLMSWGVGCGLRRLNAAKSPAEKKA